LANNNTNWPDLAKDSLAELQYIFSWSNSRSKFNASNIILVGGWAVHAFNPWKYSLDIDLIISSRFKKTLINELYLNREFIREKDSSGNNLFLKKYDSGDIYLDFLPKKDLFHGTNHMLNLLEFTYEPVTINITNSYGYDLRVTIPEISILFLLKLKAAWDRSYDLSAGNSYNREHLLEKFAKDCGDLIALLHCDGFRFARIDLISQLLSKYYFLKEFLVKGMVEEKSEYDRITREKAKDLVEKLLNLI
jgi:hypothetical protein